MLGVKEGRKTEGSAREEIDKSSLVIVDVAMRTTKNFVKYFVKYAAKRSMMIAVVQ